MLRYMISHSSIYSIQSKEIFSISLDMFTLCEYYVHELVLDILNYVNIQKFIKQNKFKYTQSKEMLRKNHTEINKRKNQLS
jgi:hypothetical protein